MRDDVKSALGRASAGVVLLVFVAAAFVLFTWWRWGHFVKTTIQFVVVHLAAQSGISTTLLYGIVIIGTIPFFWAVGKYMYGAWFWLRGLGPGLRLYKSVHGIIIVVYVGIYFLAMFWVDRHSLADKFCAVTPEGIHVFDDRIKDPVYGVQAEPCTPDQIVAIKRTEPGVILGPQKIEIADARNYPFFDSVTHAPRIWYSRNPEGVYAFYDRPGYDPVTGAPMHPIDEGARKEIIRALDEQAAQTAQAKKQEGQAAQKRQRDAVAGRFVNTAISRHAGTTQAAVLLFSNDERSFGTLRNVLDTALAKRGLLPVDSFFKPEFVKEGRAAQLLAGDWNQAMELGLGDRIDVIILGKATVDATPSTEFPGLITTNLNLDLSCLNPDRQSVCGSRSVTTIGAGYSREASLENASGKVEPAISAFAEGLRIR